MQSGIVNNIFIDASAISVHWHNVFLFQYNDNLVYRNWCNALKIKEESVTRITQIPFLPISFFKTHTVICGNFEPEIIFESSGTTVTINSKHYLKEKSIYQKSFEQCFDMFYGNAGEYCLLFLLPSYLERQNSSLILMADELIKKSGHPQSGFFLYDYELLHKTLLQMEARNQKTIMVGVTYALLDFAEQFPMQLKNTIVMETGGMKGRRMELTRPEVHDILKKQLGVEKIHSEYGMTELLSQAYSKGDGRFYCPPWMKVLVRNEQDPLQMNETGRGLLTIIDLANMYSCAFIATEDVGEVFEDGSFEVWGRLDNSDVRGCSLMVI